MLFDIIERNFLTTQYIIMSKKGNKVFDSCGVEETPEYCEDPSLTPKLAAGEEIMVADLCDPEKRRRICGPAFTGTIETTITPNGTIVINSQSTDPADVETCNALDAAGTVLGTVANGDNISTYPTMVAVDCTLVDSNENILADDMAAIPSTPHPEPGSTTVDISSSGIVSISSFVPAGGSVSCTGYDIAGAATGPVADGDDLTGTTTVKVVCIASDANGGQLDIDHDTVQTIDTDTDLNTQATIDVNGIPVPSDSGNSDEPNYPIRFINVAGEDFSASIVDGELVVVIPDCCATVSINGTLIEADLTDPLAPNFNIEVTGCDGEPTSLTDLVRGFDFVNGGYDPNTSVPVEIDRSNNDVPKIHVRIPQHGAVSSEIVDGNLLVTSSIPTGGSLVCSEYQPDGTLVSDTIASGDPVADGNYVICEVFDLNGDLVAIDSTINTVVDDSDGSVGNTILSTGELVVNATAGTVVNEKFNPDGTSAGPVNAGDIIAAGCYVISTLTDADGNVLDIDIAVAAAAAKSFCPYFEAACTGSDGASDHTGYALTAVPNVTGTTVNSTFEYFDEATQAWAAIADITNATEVVDGGEVRITVDCDGTVECYERVLAPCNASAAGVNPSAKFISGRKNGSCVGITNYVSSYTNSNVPVYTLFTTTPRPAGRANFICFTNNRDCEVEFELTANLYAHMDARGDLRNDPLENFHYSMELRMAKFDRATGNVDEWLLDPNDSQTAQFTAGPIGDCANRYSFITDDAVKQVTGLSAIDGNAAPVYGDFACHLAFNEVTNQTTLANVTVPAGEECCLMMIDYIRLDPRVYWPAAGQTAGDCIFDAYGIDEAAGTTANHFYAHAGYYYAGSTPKDCCGTGDVSITDGWVEFDTLNPVDPTTL